MNFVKFPVASTNIFPIANTVNGGQLVTEYNLRSRESVYTDSSVKYMIGPSFVHSEDDFKVTVALGSGSGYFADTPAATSSSVIQVSKGRAVVNGHFVECLTDITIDMVDANAASIADSETPLTGNLSIGLKAMYSTERNLSGSILTENSTDMYEGIQVIILPTSEFVLPSDSPTDPSQVNAHLLLATFNYVNGNISKIVSNPDKCAMLGGERIVAIDDILSKNYPSKRNLDPLKFYTLCGKYNIASEDWSLEWCDSTDSVMVWDANVTMMNTQPMIGGKVLKAAMFAVDEAKGQVDLIVPHKQIDGMANSIANGSNQSKFFAPSVIPFPIADYDTGSPGAVDSSYTANVRAVSRKIEQMYALPNGKQRLFVKELSSTTMLPPIRTEWNDGDYILVGEDASIQYTLAETSRKPSTMYIVTPGTVLSITYARYDVEDDPPTPDGVELSRIVGSSMPNTVDKDVYNNEYWHIENFNGRKGIDYFTYVFDNQYYYYVVSDSGVRNYSDAVLVTGSVPLAAEDVVGGFLNSPDTAVDDGYVYLDSKGYLRLRDYALLRSGTLAYQLQADYSVPNGLTITEIQNYLDEYVNQRVAFPNAYQLVNSDPNRIHVYIEISDTQTENGVLNIYSIDSRFNTSVCFHITCAEGVDCTINISDCEKVQIHSDITKTDLISNVTINVYRSKLYYDKDVFDFIESMQDISLWYERFSTDDPILTVEDMTVSQETIGSAFSDNNVEAITNWSTVNVNDNHFALALHSITFDASGYVVGCGVYVRNSSASNVQAGKYVVRESLNLPQGPDLLYPTSRMKKPINVTGQFISSYNDSYELTVQDTKFSLMTQVYESKDVVEADGDIAFLIDAYTLPVDFGNQVNEWSPSVFHLFDGKTMI